MYNCQNANGKSNGRSWVEKLLLCSCLLPRAGPLLCQKFIQPLSLRSPALYPCCSSSSTCTFICASEQSSIPHARTLAQFEYRLKVQQQLFLTLFLSPSIHPAISPLVASVCMYAYIALYPLYKLPLLQHLRVQGCDGG